MPPLLRWVLCFFIGVCCFLPANHCFMLIFVGCCWLHSLSQWSATCLLQWLPGLFSAHLTVCCPASTPPHFRWGFILALVFIYTSLLFASHISHPWVLLPPLIPTVLNSHYLLLQDAHTVKVCLHWCQTKTLTLHKHTRESQIQVAAWSSASPSHWEERSPRLGLSLCSILQPSPDDYSWSFCLHTACLSLHA